MPSPPGGASLSTQRGLAWFPGAVPMAAGGQAPQLAGRC